MEAMSFVTEDRKTAQESTFPNTYTFDLFGGVNVSLTFLVLDALYLLDSEACYLWRISFHVVQLLQRHCKCKYSICSQH